MGIRQFRGIAAGLFILAAALAQAQDTASLTGTVRDSTGAIVAGAQVTVSSAEHGIKRDTRTNSDGEYAESALPAPGTYNITVTSQGFRKYEAKGVVLNVAQKVRVDVALQVGAANTQVTVEGTSVAEVETQSSELGGTVTGKEIAQLQLNGRNFTQLVTLVPGVSNQTGQDEAGVGITGSVQYSMNGGRVEYNNCNRGVQSADLELRSAVRAQWFGHGRDGTEVRDPLFPWRCLRICPQRRFQREELFQSFRAGV
jgi:hypothetical protein